MHSFSTSGLRILADGGYATTPEGKKGSSFSVRGAPGGDCFIRFSRERYDLMDLPRQHKMSPRTQNRALVSFMIQVRLVAEPASGFSSYSEVGRHAASSRTPKYFDRRQWRAMRVFCNTLESRVCSTDRRCYSCAPCTCMLVWTVRIVGKL